MLSWKLAEPTVSKEHAQQTVSNVIVEYVEVMRHLQSHYRLEPAGSHGVWGLDDYHHVPFIFGAAQLRGRDSEIPCKIVTDKQAVAELAKDYLYMAMIHWIHENKKGPFHEHSNILFNVSGVESWEKISGGMLKMFIGEVLTKRNIAQHLLFTKLFPWE